MGNCPNFVTFSAPDMDAQKLSFIMEFMEYFSVFISGIYSNIVPFVVLLGILIFVHELGHFLVARWCGVRVEVFSLGFGKKILSYKRGDTDYCISLIPLGGYVKMFGEQGSDQVKTEEDKKVSFTHKNVFQRMAIVIAGPLMNFLFAVFVFAFLIQLGEKAAAPVIAEVIPASEAEKQGLSSGDKILTAGGKEVKSFDQFQEALNAAIDGKVQVRLQTAVGQSKELELNVSSINNPNIFSAHSKLGHIEGLSPVAKASIIAVVVDSPAYKAGLRTGDRVIKINEHTISMWHQVKGHFQAPQADLNLEVERGDGESKQTLRLFIKKSDLFKHSEIKAYGFDDTELYVGQVVVDSPAAKAGLEKFDKIYKINGTAIEKWDDITKTIRSYDGKEALTFTLIREGAEIIKKITPQVTTQTTAYGQEDKRFTVGIMSYVDYVEPESVIINSPSVFHSVHKGFTRSVDVSYMYFMSFIRLFQGEVSVKNVGGMVSIGKVAKDSFQIGLQAFLSTMGILSISLFILNLLPIPVLDGGHLVFYTIELIKGSPLSMKKMEMAQQVGLFLLLGLMVLAQLNDIIRFLF